MGKFNEGDKVRILKGSGSAHEGKVGTVADPHWQISQSDWPLVKIDVGDGKYAFPDEDYCELAEDPYEYNIEYTDERTGKSHLHRQTWEPDTEWLKRKVEDAEAYDRKLLNAGGSLEYSRRLVKRRKAGEIEDAS